MKITAVEPILLRGQTTYQATTGAAEATDSGDWQMLVRVATDEGLVGWSDAETLSTAAGAVIAGQGMSVLGFRTLRELLLGEDPRDTERLWDKLYIGSAYYGRRGLAMQCISSIDNCLWSIRAQAANMPLCQLLGGARRDRIMAYASTLFRATPEANAQAARDYVKRGFHAVKFGWGVFGQDPARDVEIVAAIRAALGPDRHMMIDPGWYGASWTKPWQPRTQRDNERLCASLAPYKPEWIEDFIHPENFEEYAHVRAGSSSKLAAGEQLATHWEFQRFISMGCVDVIQPDLTRCGGLTVARRVAQMAIDHGIDLVPHSWLTDLLHAYSLHLIVTLPKAMFLEFNVAQSPLTRGVCGGTLKLNPDGTVSLPPGPGLGVNVDEDFVRAHRANV